MSEVNKILSVLIEIVNIQREKERDRERQRERDM
jgi:hypothetical protein